MTQPVFAIALAQEAHQDLNEIQNYLFENHAENGWENLKRRFERTTQLLEMQPFLGTITKKASVLKIRVNGTPYSIFYNVDAAEKMVYVVHFWHGARRSPRLD